MASQAELRKEKGKEKAAWGSEKARALSKECLFQTWTPRSFGPWDSDTRRKGTDICPKKGVGDILGHVGEGFPSLTGPHFAASSQSPTLGRHLVVIRSPAETCIRAGSRPCSQNRCVFKGSGITDLTQAWTGPKMEGVVGTVAKRETTALSEVAACQLPPH